MGMRGMAARQVRAAPDISRPNRQICSHCRTVMGSGLEVPGKYFEIFWNILKYFEIF